MTGELPKGKKGVRGRAEGEERPLISVGTLRVTPRAKQLVLEALDSNRLSYGPMMKAFESRFARLHGCQFGIMSNSGTSALQIALQAMKEMHGWRDGDEVLIPAVTFVATANIVLHNRMQPVLVDVDPLYYELDPGGIEAKLSPRTRAIIPVHLFGQPADMDPIRAIAAKHQLKVIEDSAETMFAAYRGQRVGGLGDIACFSTYVAHLIVTGVGGLNTTNDPEYAIRMRSLINHGRDAIYLSIDDDDAKSGEELSIIAARRFKFVSVGHSFRATELEAALGLAQLEEAESIIAARRANARYLIERLGPLGDRLQLPATRPGCEHSFMMFPVVLRDEPKEALVNYLERNGVETRDMLPLTNQPVYRGLLRGSEEDHPVARWINGSGFYVGCHQELGPFELDHMVDLFERYFRRQTTGMDKGVCLVLATDNNRLAVRRTLDELPTGVFKRIVAVDRGSRDGTVEELQGSGVEVVPLDRRGLLYMLSHGGLPIGEADVVLFDAGGLHDPGEIVPLLLALERGYDMVVASRFTQGGQRHDRHSLVRYRSIGNRAFTLLANLLFFGNFSDALTPFRAVKHRRIAAADLDQQGLCGFYQLSIRAMREGWKVAEIPSRESVNVQQMSMMKVLLSLPGLLRVLVKEWWGQRRGGGAA